MENDKVLDSSALLIYFEGQDGARRMTEILQEASESGRDLLISVINWGEILYVIEVRYGKEKRHEIERLMSQMHLEVVNADQDLTREAAGLKAESGLPYADSFAAALALSRKASLVTTDNDFRPLKGKLTLEWL